MNVGYGGNTSHFPSIYLNVLFTKELLFVKVISIWAWKISQTIQCNYLMFPYKPKVLLKISVQKFKIAITKIHDDKYLKIGCSLKSVQHV